MPVDPAIPPAGSGEQRLQERVAQLERRLAALEQFLSGGGVQIPVVSALPTHGRQGRLLILASDGQIYKDTGSAWTVV